MFTPSSELVKDRLVADVSFASRQMRRQFARTRERQRALSRMIAQRKRELLLQDSACGRLVSDQPVDQPALQRRPDRERLGGADSGTDGQGFGGNLRRN